jgi:hypothetical protein
MHGGMRAGNPAPDQCDTCVRRLRVRAGSRPGGDTRRVLPPLALSNCSPPPAIAHLHPRSLSPPPAVAFIHLRSLPSTCDRSPPPAIAPLHLLSETLQLWTQVLPPNKASGPQPGQQVTAAPLPLRSVSTIVSMARPPTHVITHTREFRIIGRAAGHRGASTTQVSQYHREHGTASDTRDNSHT